MGEVGGLSEAEREALLAPCACGHTINDHGGLIPCWLCSEDGEECGTNFEVLLAERVARIVAARAAAPDALRERVEALARELDQDADEVAEIGAESQVVVDLQVSLRRMAADKIRAALADRPTDGAAT